MSERWRFVVQVLLASGLGLAALPASAHVCGGKRHVALVGEAFPFTIRADVFESEPTDYSVTLVGDPNVARVVTPLAFSSLGWGRWGMLATGVGTASFQLQWAYAPTPAAGSCSLQVDVFASSQPRATAANYLQALALADPILSLTGENFFEAAAELNLRGPLSVELELYYGASLHNRRLLDGRLGNGWLHSFDLTLIHDITTEVVEVQLQRGRVVRFAKIASVWQLQEPLDVPYALVESGGGFVLGDPRKSLLYSFDAEARLVQVWDGKGNVLALTYTGPILDAVSDGLGRTISFGYDSAHVINQISDGTRTLQLSHLFTDENENLWQLTDARGNTTTFAYDPLNLSNPGLLTSRTRPRGNVPTTQVYGAAGRVIQQTAAPNHTTTIAYGPGSTSMTDPLANVTSHAYDGAGRVTDATDAAANAISMSYDAAGRRASITDRDADVTTFTYHAPSGKVASITQADGGVTTFAYTPRAPIAGIVFHDLTQITHPDGGVETYTYDAAGNMLSATNQRGQTWTYTYDGHGQVLTRTNPAGGVDSLTYNVDGTLASSMTPAGDVTTYG